jgi:branched-chain amino acid transport system substrate-binding protein
MSDPEMADDIFFANNYSDSEPQLIETRVAYVDKFGEEPINKAYLGYDKILIIADALRRAGSADPVALAKALEETRDLQGTTGKITISPETHQPVGLSMVMYMIKEGEYIDLGRHVPESHK